MSIVRLQSLPIIAAFICPSEHLRQKLKSLDNIEGGKSSLGGEFLTTQILVKL